jgi:hypothetical protein
MYQTFGALAAPMPGVAYLWTTNNATVWSQSNDGQYAYVNFNNAGASSVTLTAIVTATGCKTTSTANVAVGNNISDNVRVVYINGTFVALENDENKYQWGYDDMRTYQSYNIDGAVNQDYHEPNPDFTNKRYWVMTWHGDCWQKSMYNAPAGPAPHLRGAPSMRVFPNPVNSNVNVEMLDFTGGDLEFQVTNMLGQRLLSATTSDFRVVMDATSLAPGAYLVDCYSNGVKIATARFIKN